MNDGRSESLIAVATLKSWETDQHRPRIGAKTKRLADALEASTLWLIEGEGAPDVGL